MAHLWEPFFRLHVFSSPCRFALHALSLSLSHPRRISIHSADCVDKAQREGRFRTSHPNLSHSSSNNNAQTAAVRTTRDRFVLSSLSPSLKFCSSQLRRRRWGEINHFQYMSSRPCRNGLRVSFRSPKLLTTLGTQRERLCDTLAPLARGNNDRNRTLFGEEGNPVRLRNSIGETIAK